MKKTYQWTVALILLGFAAAGIFLSLAPDTIPVHYDIQGRVDRWGSKYEYLIMPGMNLVFGLFMAWLARREGKQGREMNEKIVSVLNNWILVLFNGMWIFFMFQAIDPESSGAELGELTGKAVLMLMMASLIPLGNIMPKAQRNSVFGLRTKWSNANDYCWQQSQRVGGFVMVGTGMLGVMLCALLPVRWSGFVTVGLLLAAAAGCTWASYRIYLRSQVQ